MIARVLCAVALLGAVALAGEPGRDEYGTLLGEVVRTDGIDYAKLKSKRALLDRHVDWLATAEPGKTDAERIAFWINAYNALTLERVLETRPVEGKYKVTDIKDFWDGRRWTVAGRKVTLDGIEHEILRVEFREPRIHFAVNCASRSCPPLRSAPYRAGTLDADLTQAARAYLGDKSQNRFDAAAQRAEVSHLFKWFRGDFEVGRKEEAARTGIAPLQLFLARYAPSDKLARALRAAPWTVSFKEYDWTLNESSESEWAAVLPEGSRGEVNPLWLVVYLIATVGLLMYGFHAFKMLRWRRKHGARYLARIRAVRDRSPLGISAFPKVLVQVPVYNEAGVVERVIDAVVALRYPREALEIQVLDDSTDETVELVDAAVARHLADGAPITVLHRDNRDGFKAGALAAGLAVSDAEFVAIFDADFMPKPDFLEQALPLFDFDDKVACVQGRWGHLNRYQNWLTRAQAIGVDAHFHIQQLARAASGKFLNFNGTAGMWRRSAITDAGGWRGDTITEDLDLSYRAQLRGWRIVFDPDIHVPAELPPTLGAYKSQQRRWACGSTQCARKYLGAVWRSDLPFSTKSEATVHLCGYAVCVAMSILILLLPFGMGHVPMLLRYPAWWPLWIGIWIAALGPISVSFAGQVVAGRFPIHDVFSAFLLGLGSCVNNAIAVMRGLFRPIKTFVRTPKQGSTLAPLRTQAPILEQFMMLFTTGAVLHLAQTRPWATASYALFCCSGFCVLAAYYWLVERRPQPEKA